MENLNLIDWKLVGFSSLWILGAAVLLTVFGFAYDESTHQSISFRSAMNKPGSQLAINLGLSLFSAGQAGLSEVVWQRLAWGGLAAAFLFYAWIAFRSLGDDVVES